ncbi:MAG: hypothetical protein WA066_07310, partial [Candidatus Omnitrophota bacterium]
PVGNWYTDLFAGRHWHDDEEIIAEVFNSEFLAKDPLNQRVVDAVKRIRQRLHVYPLASVRPFIKLALAGDEEVKEKIIEFSDTGYKGGDGFKEANLGIILGMIEEGSVDAVWALLVSRHHLDISVHETGSLFQKLMKLALKGNETAKEALLSLVFDPYVDVRDKETIVEGLEQVLPGLKESAMTLSDGGKTIFFFIPTLAGLGGNGDLPFVLNTAELLAEMYPRIKSSMVFKDGENRDLHRISEKIGLEDKIKIANRVLGPRAWDEIFERNLIKTEDLAVIYMPTDPYGIESAIIPLKKSLEKEGIKTLELMDFGSDVSNKSKNPENWVNKKKKAYAFLFGEEQDFIESRCQWRPLNTGFGPDCIGIAPLSRKFKEKVDEFSLSQTEIRKFQLTDRLLGSVADEQEKTRIAKSDWGLLYVFNLSSWESYFIALEKARELDRDFGAKDLTVFVSSYSLNEPIPDVREALRGIVKRGYNIYMPPSFAKKTDHRINFVDIRSHLAEGLFDERFLLSKDLPLVIRGPHTLIKAVYLAAKDKEGLIWAWEPQPHQKAAKEQFPVFLKEKSGLDKKDQSLIIDMTNNGVNNPEIFLLRSKYRQIWREFSQAILKNLDFEKGIKAKVDEWAVSSPALNRVTVGSSPVEEKNRTVPGSPISRESLLDALREALTKVGLPKHVIERAEQIIQEWGDASVSSSGIRSLVSRDKNSRKQSSSSVNKEFGNTPVQTRSSSPAITSETGIARDAPKQLSLKLAVCTLHLRQSILGLTSRPISDAIVRRADREFPNIFYDTQEYYLYDIVRVLRNSRDTYHNLFSLISLISNQLGVC